VKNHQDTVEKNVSVSKDLCLAALYIMNADKARFGTLIAQLANQFLLGHNEYPSDLTEAQGLLTNY
jgi:Zinc knuckle